AIDAGERPGTTTNDAQRIKQLEAEVRELKRANEMADSSGGRNEFCELLRWCQISERLAGTAVERVLDHGQLRAADDAQIGALGQVLAEQAVGVLVAAALPGRVRVAEVDRDPRTRRELGVLGHLRTLVPRDR